jgi:hypothetical protein
MEFVLFGRGQTQRAGHRLPRSASGLASGELDCYRKFGNGAFIVNIIATPATPPAKHKIQNNFTMVGDEKL